MSQAKSQGVSFHPSQLAGKASSSNPGNEWKDFTEDDDDLDENQFKFVVKDHVLFCIDASSSMQDPLPDHMFKGDEFNKYLDPDIASKVTGKGKTPLHIALEVVHLYEKAKALVAPQDSVGVLFYNIDPNTRPPTLANGERSETFRRGTVLYQPLRQVNVEEIKRVRALMEEANLQLGEQSEDETERSQPNILGETFRAINQDELLDIADVFECCNHVFRDAGTKLNGTKRVFLITNNDRPEIQLKNRDLRVDSRGPARTRFIDLNNLGVSVDPFFISKPEEEFDQDHYWNDILMREIEDDDEPHDLEVREKTRAATSSDGFQKLIDLMDERAQRSGQRRVVFRIPLKFGGKDGDIEIGVQGYSLISAAVKPAYRLYDLSGRVAREVKTKTEYNAASTGAKLDPSEIGYAYNFGTSDVATDVLDNYWAAGEPLEVLAEGYEELEDVKLGKGLTDSDTLDVKGKPRAQPIRTRVTFTNAEIKQFRTLDLDPQIKIIGFQDEKILRFEQNIKHAVFIYPDETTFAGSTRTFSALLTICARKKKHALALVVTRRNTTPTFACLIPQEETFDDEGVQANPPGFHMIYLPFADDMRAKPDKIPKKLQQCTEEQRETFKIIIKKLKFQTTNYEPTAYNNPALAFFYAKLQAIAFDEPTFEPEKVPDTTKPLYDGIRKNAGAWLRSLNEMVNKDSRSFGGSTSTTRPPKRAAPDSGFDPTETENLFATGKAVKLVIPQLKEYARYKGIPLESNLKKAEIIAKIEQHRLQGK